MLHLCTICIDKMNFCGVSVSFGGVFSEMVATTELNAQSFNYFSANAERVKLQ